MREIRPIGDLGTRVQEAGRLRMGVKSGKAMKALDTWRFTSPHEDCIHQIAALYGGEVKPWDDPKASHRNQFEVITAAKNIKVYVPPGGLSQHYETWSGARCERRCDGITAEIPSRGPDPTQEVPCLCTQEDAMTCKPHTRISVVLAGVIFRGVWRLDTKSWNAADELPAMEAMIDSLQETRDIVEAELVLEQRSRMTAGGKRNFVVPTLSLTDTAEALAAGDSGIRPAIGAPVSDAPALGAGPVMSHDETVAPLYAKKVDELSDAEVATLQADLERQAANGGWDDEVAEAEVIYEPAEVKVEIIALANVIIFDPDDLEVGVCLGVSDGTVRDVDGLDEAQRARAMDFMADVRADRIEIVGVREEGRLTIKRKGAR